MNLVKLLFFVSLLSSYSSFAQESYELSDYSKRQLKLLKSLSGKYANSRGESLEVNFNILDEEGQLNLFGPQRFEFGGVYESKPSEYQSYEFELDSFEKVKKGVYQFSTIEDDCDDPGCSDYEVFYTFKKNRKGEFYVTIDISVSVDAEDLSYIFEENADMDRDELSKVLDKGCKEYYGKNAYLTYFVDDYKNSVYCAYEKKIFLKKVK